MPQIQIVSYSELDTFRQCPLKHLLSYKQRWTKEKAEDSALGKGTLWHNALEQHHLVLQRHQQERNYRTPSPGDQRLILGEAKDAAMTKLADADGNQSETQELMEWVYDGYVEFYGVDDEWMILGVEMAAQVPLPWPDGRPSHYHIKMKLDRLVRSKRDGQLWIEDHKSGANKPTEFELQLDDQFGLYTWALKFPLGQPVIGSMHSYSRTTQNTGDRDPSTWPKGKKYKPQTLEDRNERFYLNRSDRELKALADDAFAAARNAYPPKGMQLPLYSAPDIRNCGWKCDFKEAHLMLREGLTINHVMKAEGFHQDFTRH
ncbi:Cas4 family exonuclease [Arthrobacter phage Chridison]|uniref:Cas4 family exonuclease n=2 Tax=Korravirus hunterdalle TaxID=1982080 RepID=A0A0U4B7K9_9CAUD|nr:exonuclease [Arthrobacter phage HunterDalle]ALY09189.1 Cas4 family exonuclease [Arthrobacter phage HunterDalle]ALY10704.1 Cas4 family exonuclease [Arthrobacter phage Vulture]WAB09091.1 Cas4 family exonuclease [Arthrobacter phage Chridison]